MDNNKRVVLYADDDQDDHMLLEDSFRTVAPEVELKSVADGHKALDYLKACKEALPCLLILDVNMPGLSGKEVLKRIKIERQYDSLPIVMFTTSANPGDRDELARYGVDMITKPTNLAEFEQTVQQLLAYCYTT
jgi:CheY-like chemotaxis protein